MKTELLQLIRETKACLMQEFKKGELFEAGFLRPLSGASPQTKTAAPLPPPPAPRIESAKPKPRTPVMEKKEEIPTKAPEIKKSKTAELKESNEMLHFLKEKLPHLSLLDPPVEFIDLCFLYENEEEALVAKIKEALDKVKISSTLLQAGQFSESSLKSPFKAFVATKKRIQESSNLLTFAGRRQDGQPHLGGILLLIMPDSQALESPEVKRAFWNSLLQASSS